MPHVRQIRWLATIAMLVLAPALAYAEFTEDTLDVVKENVAKERAVLVDVRSQEEWDEGHIKGSFFVPVTALRDGDIGAKELAKMLPKKRVLYTFCVMGIRAEAAGEYLQEMGYDVRVLEPGYKDLIKAGFKKAAKKKSGDENS